MTKTTCPTNIKKCSRCGENKNISNFNVSIRDGYRSMCYTCETVYNRERCEWYDIAGHPSLYTIDLISPPALSGAAVEFFEEAHD